MVAVSRPFGNLISHLSPTREPSSPIAASTLELRSSARTAASGIGHDHSGKVVQVIERAVGTSSLYVIIRLCLREMNGQAKNG